jgi:hypothetical protein
MGTVVAFPLQPIDLDRVRIDSDEPCLVLILPVVWVERDDGSAGGGNRGGRGFSRETNASPDT